MPSAVLKGFKNGCPIPIAVLKGIRKGIRHEVPDPQGHLKRMPYALRGAQGHLKRMALSLSRCPRGSVKGWPYPLDGARGLPIARLLPHGTPMPSHKHQSLTKLLTESPTLVPILVRELLGLDSVDAIFHE
jgi:hypothetical protein